MENFTSSVTICKNQCEDISECESGDHVSCGPLAAVITTSTACFSTHFGGSGTVRYVTLSPALRTSSPSILENRAEKVTGLSLFLVIAKVNSIMSRKMAQMTDPDIICKQSIDKNFQLCQLTQIYGQRYP